MSEVFVTKLNNLHNTLSEVWLYSVYTRTHTPPIHICKRESFSETAKRRRAEISVHLSKYRTHYTRAIRFRFCRLLRFFFLPSRETYVITSLLIFFARFVVRNTTKHSTLFMRLKWVYPLPYLVQLYLPFCFYINFWVIAFVILFTRGFPQTNKHSYIDIY